MNKIITLILVFVCILTQAQNQLYPNEFALNEVRLLNGPFKNAQDLNITSLLKYDVDRLLQPYLTEAGLRAKGLPYVNWDGLAGHVGGHYLSAMAIHYASSGDATCKARMDYMITELKACQLANGNGYLGGIPNSKAMWAELKTGQFALYNSAWVPWYNVHKIYAGLRDAWMYGGSEDAKGMFLKLCDWGIDILSGLSDAQLQTMLNTEFGGMNEVYADAYQITGNEKYLITAKKFTHKQIYDAMVVGKDNLDNKHANTQIPKIVGFSRIAQVDSTDPSYGKASRFFWETVVNTRSLAMGGNSRGEHFPTAANCEEYTTHREGPESCNTYNMMKLTEDLFGMEPLGKYADYYERAMYNHILSTQHPEHGGYVYFTPVRPRHYRVYSDVNKAMWCCVGSGMENHGKYGQFIYTHQEDDLFVNLFIASELSWTEKGLTLKQETSFPYEEKTKFTVSLEESGTFTINFRNPSWVTEGAFKVIINGETLPLNTESGSYASIERKWDDGDAIELLLPMHNTYEEMPNVPGYVAFLHGPILLSAKTGTENLDGLIAGDGRWGHIANGSLLPLAEAPFAVSSRDSIADKLQAIEGEALKFSAPELFEGQPEYKSLVFEPFFQIHDARYMMYWMALTEEEYAPIREALEAEEKEKLEIDERTIDGIATGEQQPDADHKVQGSNTNTGTHQDEFWRDASSGGFFSYEMSTQGRTDLSLFVRYWGYEWGNRTFDILVDDVIIANENLARKWNVNDFKNVEYAIDPALLTGKEIITVRFQAKPSHTAGGVFYLRLLKAAEVMGSAKIQKQESELLVEYRSDLIRLKAPEQNSSHYRLFTNYGSLLSSGNFEKGEASINISGFAPGVHLLWYEENGNYFCQKIMLN